MTARTGLERRHESRLRTILTSLAVTIHENSERAVRLSVSRDKSKLWVVDRCLIHGRKCARLNASTYQVFAGA